jgi:hypothetical protein
MSAKLLPFLGFLVAFSVGCAKRYPSPASQPIDNVSYLTRAVEANRKALDSVVLEIHRASGDTSSSAVARSRKLRMRAAVLDSAYRASLADLLETINASAAGVTAASARFPIEKPPAPFVRAFADGSNWMLESPLIYQIGKSGAHVIVVPRGFITDFASIPQPLRVLRDLLPTTDRYGLPALVHDYLYWRQDCTREQADNIMEIAMMDAGVSLLERKVIHEGLRQFGQSAWDENSRARQSGLIRTVGAPHDLIPLSGKWAEYREWLRTIGAKEGVEYRVPEAVCAFADSSS